LEKSDSKIENDRWRPPPNATPLKKLLTKHTASSSVNSNMVTLWFHALIMIDYDLNNQQTVRPDINIYLSSISLWLSLQFGMTNFNHH